MSKLRRIPLLIMAGSMGLALSFSPAAAMQYKFGDVDFSLDTTVSLGIGIRTSKQSCTKISEANGGCPVNSSGQYNDINTDDGDVNFGRWDPYAETVKVVSEAQAKWKNYGAFLRVKGFYDYIGDQVAGQHNTDYGRRPLIDAARGNDAHNAAAWDFAFSTPSSMATSPLATTMRLTFASASRS